MNQHIDFDFYPRIENVDEIDISALTEAIILIPSYQIERRHEDALRAAGYECRNVVRLGGLGGFKWQQWVREPEATPLVHNCEECGMVFPTVQALTDHDVEYHVPAREDEAMNRDFMARYPVEYAEAIKAQEEIERYAHVENA